MDPRFFQKEGAQKDVVPTEREASSPLRPESRADLRALEALGVFDALLVISEPYFLSILIRNGRRKKKYTQ